MSEMPVRVIRRKKSAALIEFLDEDVPNRVIVPDAEVHEVGEKVFVDSEIIAMGMPYGVAWDLYPGEFSPEQLQKELHRHGVFTYNDLVVHPDLVLAALRAVLQLTYTDLEHFARMQGVSNE